MGVLWKLVRGLSLLRGGKFAGSTMVGTVGGAVARSASGPICMAIGVSTGGIGGVVCVAAIVGVGTWAGTTLGAMGGEIGGEIMYERTLP